MVGHSKCLGGGREFGSPPLFLLRVFKGRRTKKRTKMNKTHAVPGKPPTPALQGGMSNLNTTCYERSSGGA